MQVKRKLGKSSRPSEFAVKRMNAGHDDDDDDDEARLAFHGNFL